ncbi:MAG: 3'-5' exonuclease, partial [Bacteroidaceae bacterium]|nr:3'-5' exonuclease [Bacteroidaceae bacterium]
VQNIYHKMEKRNLSAAYKFYCNKELEAAHTALADTKATYEVLQAQLDIYGEQLENNVSFLSTFSRRNNNVDLAGRVVYNEEGVEIINFGKHKGRSVVDVLRKEPGYFNWIMQGEFTQNTKQVFMKIRLREKL